MGQLLHGSAKTAHAVQSAIQRSKASIQELASRYGLGPTQLRNPFHHLSGDSHLHPLARCTAHYGI